MDTMLGCIILLIAIDVTSATLDISEVSCLNNIKLAACKGLSAEVGDHELPQSCAQLLEEPPRYSCKDILCHNSSAVSSYYTIQLADGSYQEVYCDMEGSNCGGVGGWTRVAYVDMTEPGATCPDGLQQENDFEMSGLNLCGKNTTGCEGTFFSTFNITYQEVCGQLVGYQFGTPEAFARPIVITSLTLESQYLDGISITHGDAGSRTHIWSYAAGVTQQRTDRFGCPCNTGSSVSAPSFVGDDYYCESAANSITTGVLYPNDVLWDGDGLVSAEPGCLESNMPWFTKTLPETTCNDIELRSCQDEGLTTEGVLLEIIEIYIR